MDTITEFSDKFDSTINQFLEPVVANKYVMPVLALILILYVTFVRPTLPQYVQDLFHNNIFRFVVLAYIVYRANHDIQSAVLLSAVFLITMHMVNKQYVEGFATQTQMQKDKIAAFKSKFAEKKAHHTPLPVATAPVAAKAVVAAAPVATDPPLTGLAKRIQQIKAAREKGDQYSSTKDFNN